MNKGYVAFIGVLAVLWLITMIIDIMMTAAIYPSRFGTIANVTSSVTSQFRTPIYVIIGLPEAIGLFYPPYYFWAIWIGIVTAAVTIFIIISVYRTFPRFENSALYRIAEFFALNLFLSEIYIAFVQFIGHPITSPIPTGPTHFIYNFFLLTNAGLYEELITRVIYIGIPLFIYYAWSVHGKESPSRPKKLPWWRIIWGGGYKFGKPEITVLIISSIIFGIAHAGSWSISKIPQAALGGVFLGVLFLRFGLYADVLFHFSVDSPGFLLTNLYGSPLGSVATTDFYSIVVLIFLAAGLVVSIFYLLELAKIFQSRNGRIPTSLSVTPSSSIQVPQENQYSKSTSVVCPKCGSKNVTFLYDDVYRCDDCGTVFRKS
ncbi:MAG: CPBP family glutamic-type intramembrane protease [Thermoplasmata archaeon]